MNSEPQSAAREPSETHGEGRERGENRLSSPLHRSFDEARSDTPIACGPVDAPAALAHAAPAPAQPAPAPSAPAPSAPAAAQDHSDPRDAHLPRPSPTLPLAAGPRSASDPTASVATDPIADGLWHRLDPAAPQAEAIAWWVATAIVGIAGAVTSLVLLIVVGAGISLLLAVASWSLLLAASIWAALRWPAIHWAHSSYMVHPRGLEIRQGVLWRRIISVPRSRVQHTDVLQGPVLRRFGLAALTVHTAGTEFAAVTLVGVSHATALAIRDFLLAELERDAV